jgi:DNA invertase Pin-like site-specific DNA recombinase
MKVALYTRCSSDMQENLDRSIPAQLKALRDYCEKKNILFIKNITSLVNLLLVMMKTGKNFMK